MTDSKFPIPSSKQAPSFKFQGRSTPCVRRSLESVPSLKSGFWGLEFSVSGYPSLVARRSAAFSLIEVIVAILILGIALVALTEGVTSALSSSMASEVQTTAALLAAGQIETLRAEGDYADGETEGDFGDEFAQYRWTQTISSTDIRSLHDVEVVVEDAQSGKALYDLKTMLFELPQGTNTVNLAATGGWPFSNERSQP